MRQSHIAQFRSALLRFPKNYGKSPKDLTLTVPEILARAAEMPEEKVGLSTGTMNRHMTQMGNIANICEAAGYPFADFGRVENSARKRRAASATSDRALPLTRSGRSSVYRSGWGAKVKRKDCWQAPP
jgi:hypothetical protein